MQPKIPPSLDARLQPHLQRVRDGQEGDDDILPAVFGLLLERQQEMELGTAIAAAKHSATLKGIAEHQVAIDARLEALEGEMSKRAYIALVVQVAGFVVLIGAIAFLLFRR